MEIGNNKTGNLERLKSLKKRAEEMSQDFHEYMEKLKFYESDIEFMIKKTTILDNKLEKIINHQM